MNKITPILFFSLPVDISMCFSQQVLNPLTGSNTIVAISCDYGELLKK